ncbi:MAG TPA: class II aldolase/adducin family protein [Desulfitobacteriaceae bacterium]|nr:class II aldolase/adducin family protein [Desulfitobacteriaceae bacterium]
MRLKREIINIGQNLAASGLVVGTLGNISAWDAGRSGFWITPSGIDYSSLKTKDLVLINSQGQIMKGFRKPSTEFLMHLHTYSRRPDIAAIIHTHSVYASAHAVARLAIPGIVEDMVQIIGGAVEVAPYHLTGTQELAEAVALALAAKNAVLLANHGVVGVGQGLAEALKVCQITEKTAQIHAFSRMLGTPVSLSSEDMEQMRKGYLENYGQGSAGKEV